VSRQSHDPLLVTVSRGGEVESQHRVHVAVVHAEQGLGLAAGNPGHRSFVRSAIKMFQVWPFADVGGDQSLAFTPQQLALTTASHGGEPFHVSGVRAMLQKAGAREDQLACGAHAPMHAPSAETLRAAGEAPGRIHNNCSGKHAGMLAMATLSGWPLDGYHRLEHAVQQRVRESISTWMDIPVADIGVGIDGCGLPTFAMPLHHVATGCARFAAAAADGVPAPSRIVNAMTTHPEYVAGTDRLCTDLMRAAGGRLFAKVGAEGYYCAGVPGQRLGIALKVEDGAWRAVEPALLATLRTLDAVTQAELRPLARYAFPDIINTRGEIVGVVCAVTPW
jgi:L-asparaginase II